MSFYLDTNVLASLLFADIHTARAYAWRRKHTDDLCVGEWAAAELGALVLRWVRGRLMPENVAEQGLADFDDFVVRKARLLALPTSAGAFAIDLARDPSLKLSAADALHLACAVSGGHILVTFDERLAEAARRRGLAVEVP